MKTKLLRKVRKQYSIFYNEKGHYWGDVHFKEVYAFVNNYSEYDIEFSNNKQELINIILQRVRSDYYYLGSIKRQKSETKKVWYNGN